MKRNKFSTIALLLVPLVLFAFFFYRMADKGKAYGGGIDKGMASAHMEELTKASFGGRQTGTEGGREAAEYIKSVLCEQGIDVAQGGDYASRFAAVAAVVESSEFLLWDEKGDSYEAFEIYEDYNPETAGLGGSIDYTGDILIVDGAVEDMPPEMLLGRVVVDGTGALTYGAKRHVLESGGEGLLYTDGGKADRTDMTAKTVDASGKEADSIFLARISENLHTRLLEKAENGIASGAEIRVRIGFPYVEGENIAGLIPAKGSDECLIFASHYDGFGSYGENGHVPGAIDNAGGVAALLELSRNISESGASPRKNIVFLFTDGWKTGYAGMEAYMRNPLFPLEKTDLIVVESMGWKGSDETWISSAEDGFLPEGLATRLVRSYEEGGVEVLASKNNLPVWLEDLSEKGVSAVRVASVGGEELEGFSATPYDNMDQWDGQRFVDNLSGCLSFSWACCFKGGFSGPHGRVGGILLMALLGILYVSYALGILYRRHPGACIGGKSMARLRYSTPAMIVEGAAGAASLALFLLALAAFAANSGRLDWRSLRGAADTIFSFLAYALGGPTMALMDDGFALSALLVGAAVAISFAAGLFAGISKAYGKGKAYGKSEMLRLALMSVPQAFVALGLFYLWSSYAAAGRAGDGELYAGLKSLALPVLSMAVPPFAWFSGKTAELTETEMAKAYVAAAKARGFAVKSIASRQVFKGVLAGSVELVPELTAFALAGLVVTEYVFALPGMMNRMISEIKSPETVFYTLLMAGALYIVFALLAKAIGVLLNHRGRC